MAFEVQTFKDIMARWASGISVITTSHAGEVQGFTANSLASVSIDPFLVSMSVVKGLYAGELMVKSGNFTINILTQDQVSWGKRFAGMVPEFKDDRFRGIDYELAVNGCPILPDVMGWMACRVYQTLDVGASILILGEVIDGAFSETGMPLVYYSRQWGYFQSQI